MEMEFFVKPGEDEEWHQYWIDERTRWYTDLGIDPDNLRHYEHPQEKLSHYSKRTVDIEYRFGFAGSEWGELEGIANRTDFDLTHALEALRARTCRYFDQAADERYMPYVIEPAAGLSRSLMTFLVDAYTEDEAPNTKGGVDKRTVLRLDPRLAPVKVAVLPLSRNADLSPKAKALAAELRRNWNVDFDDSGAIGRRYRRQDEIGTPYCVTVDFDTLEDDAVTVRERDTMKQERISLDGITSLLRRASRRLLRNALDAHSSAMRPAPRVRRPCSAPLRSRSALARAPWPCPAAPARDDADPVGGLDSAAQRELQPSGAPASAEATPYLPGARRGRADRPGQRARGRRPRRRGLRAAPGRRSACSTSRSPGWRRRRSRSRSRAGSWTRRRRRRNPYFVHATVENVGDTDLGGRAVPLYIVDGRNTLIEASTFASTFKPCPSSRSRRSSSTATRPRSAWSTSSPEQRRADRGQLPAHRGVRPDHLDRRAASRSAPAKREEGRTRPGRATPEGSGGSRGPLNWVRDRVAGQWAHVRRRPSPRPRA